MSIGAYIHRFFSRVEAEQELPSEETELVDGKAFAIRHYPLGAPRRVAASDVFVASLYESGVGVAFQVEELIKQPMLINQVSVFRFNDALGYKNAFGAVFGEKK